MRENVLLADNEGGTRVDIDKDASDHSGSRGECGPLRDLLYSFVCVFFNV